LATLIVCGFIDWGMSRSMRYRRLALQLARDTNERRA